MPAPMTLQMPPIQLPEAYTFEGFCNRINCLASALLRWPDGFRLRWMCNEHCPLSFAELFNEFTEIEVTEEPGGWNRQHSYANYVNNGSRLCHYFLSTSEPRGKVRDVYRRIIAHSAIEAACDPGEAIAVHYRGFTSRKKTSPEACVDLALTLAGRTGVSKVVLAANCDASAAIIADRLTKEGIEVQHLAGGMASDMDRTPGNVRDFVSAWHVLTNCRWAVSSALWSTVLDASRALGNEVWTFADAKTRPNHSCDLFGRFGFDWLVADLPCPSARSIETISFAEEFGTRLICYSLYGNSPLYARGMVQNIALAARHYPGWKVIVFHDHTVPIEVLAEIYRAGGELVQLNDPFPMITHRFLPAADPRVERFLVRDADSRICDREAAAVQAWIDSDLPLHIMRDHPCHLAPVMGGMWGCKGGLLPDLTTQLATFPFKGCYGDDQRFLAEFLWEPFHDKALIHDSHESGPGDSVPFPLPRNGRRFVGQRIGPDDLPLGDDESRLRDIPMTTKVGLEEDPSDHPVLSQERQRTSAS